MQRFGEKLRVLRTQHNLTLRDLAAQLGYTAHGYVNAVEKGRKKPSLEFVLKIAALFDVTADQLLRDDLEIEPTDAGVEGED